MPVSRRSVLSTALTAAAAAGALAASSASAAPARPPGRPPRRRDPVDNRFWSGFAEWHTGTRDGVRVIPGLRPGIAIGRPAGVTPYSDPHTGRTESWEYATWTSPAHRPRVPATELIASWNAHTPAGTWLRAEVSGVCSDGTATPWFVLGNWASGDGDIARASVDGQSGGGVSVWTDTLSVDDPASGRRLVSYRIRLTLHRRPGSRLTPVVHRAGAMASDIPDRFTVPASEPRTARELAVPRYSQNVHIGRYPEYDSGGEAWCSPTSSEMILEYWGRRADPAELAWVDPAFDDPQICNAARSTYDHQYRGCGNWAFNAAYAASRHRMNAVVTRLSSLTDAERLVSAGIPVITSQSFLAAELTGAGYGTAGHLMTVIGFTPEGDVIANDPAAAGNAAVRRVYRRREFEEIWLRTKRYRADGKVSSGTGGVCYLYWPERPAPAQRRVLAALGVR
ncbi:peptidase C39 family protein [Streptomyces sp. CAU 1734]|uniref:peptidase C39 family protein n=1 Tax=Streptomyces sp. CAU 1734 TaxID=3140360 RepID=UPI003260424A